MVVSKKLNLKTKLPTNKVEIKTLTRECVEFFVKTDPEREGDLRLAIIDILQGGK